MDDKGELEADFQREMLRLYNEAKNIGYHAPRFKMLIDQHPGAGVAHYLLGSDDIQTGFERLWEMDRLDLTVEYVVAHERKYRSLFSKEELARAKQRLQDHGYDTSKL